MPLLDTASSARPTPTTETFRVPAGRPTSRLLAGLLVVLAAAPASAQLAALGNEMLTALDLPAVVLEPNAGLGRSLAIGDFDGDERDDLAIGMPYVAVSGNPSAGAVVVVRGVDGRGSYADELWHQNVSGVGDVSEDGDLFGSALAVGDFNGDGIDDLAIGAIGERLGTTFETGVVHVVPGSITGLAGEDEVTLTQALGGGVRHEGAHYGASLAVGDFDSDGYDDLAVGMPGDETAGYAEAGALMVVYGSIVGLDLDTAERFDQWTLGAVSGEGDAEAGTRFATALVAADFDGDGYDDLVASAPFDSPTESLVEAGVMNLIRGSANGLVRQGNRFFSVWGSYSDPGDLAGASLAAGDFDGDGLTDLALGVPGRDTNTAEDSGAALVIRSEAGTGPVPLDFIQVRQHHAGAAVEAGDELGWAVAAGDFDCDGLDDLAVSSVAEAIGNLAFAGAVSVFPGSAEGLLDWGFTWHQDSAGIVGAAEIADQFGSSLAVGRLGRECDSLAIGVTGEAVAGSSFAGAVHLIYSDNSLFLDGFESGDVSAWQ